jgi:maleate cis-trans isomerase
MGGITVIGIQTRPLSSRLTHARLDGAGTVDAVTTGRRVEAQLAESRASLGLIIPSVNTYSEPQFNHYAPPGLGVYVSRARVAGEWQRPLPQMEEEIATSAKLLSDAEPDVIVFHCTNTSMAQGPDGEGRILEIVQEATGIPALATSQLIVDALKVLGLKRVVLLTPYKTNDPIKRYLAACGIDVASDVALGLVPRQYGNITPGDWATLAREHDSRDADGVFLSCTNTTQIEAITTIEQELGKPVVNSNQAVLWGVAKRLRAKLDALPAMPELGTLMQHLD